MIAGEALVCEMASCVVPDLPLARTSSLTGEFGC
jgi:hypothetical protein